jgi:GTPase SAR1 family protein
MPIFIHLHRPCRSSLQYNFPPFHSSDQIHRTSFYVGINVFILCYSISSPSSLESILCFPPLSKCVRILIECEKDITKKWQQELATHCPKAALILVGTKMDLRDDKETNEHLKQKKLKPIAYPFLCLPILVTLSSLVFFRIRNSSIGPGSLFRHFSRFFEITLFG